MGVIVEEYELTNALHISLSLPSLSLSLSLSLHGTIMIEGVSLKT
jgi:hypothetical protein